VLAKAYLDSLRTLVNLHSFQDDDYLFEPDDFLGFKPRSNVNVTAFAGASQFDIFTDDRGARITHASTQATDHSNIIGIGGSQTWGFGVQNQDTFLSVLGKDLRLTVSNLAVSGFGGVGSFLRLRENLDLAPSLIIYGFWEDHLNRNINPCLEDASPVCVERLYFKFSPQHDFVLTFPVHSGSHLEQMRRYYLETSTSIDIYRSIWTDMYWVSYEMAERFSTLSSWGDPVDESDDDKGQVMQAVLKEMHTLSSSVDAQLVVVWIPLYFSEDMATPPQELVALSKDLGFVLVDLQERFMSMKQSGRQLSLSGDGHMNEKAHYVVARAIKTTLVRGCVTKNFPDVFLRDKLGNSSKDSSVLC